MSGKQIDFRTGPFLVSLETDYRPVIATLRDLYDVPPGERLPGIHSFHIQLRRPAGLRSVWRPQIRFLLEGIAPFEPYPVDHAFPLLEWGLNWCIAMRAHQFLMLHAAVVERDGLALVLPAVPGSGKSTLCAALALRGWRLLSDEFGLYEPIGKVLVPLPRAVPLKNESIAVIRDFSSAARMGPLFPRTRKGDVCHLRPPGDSLARQQEPARPYWIVFPRFQRGHTLELRPVAKSQAFVRLAQNSFNYSFLRGDGFIALGHLVNESECFCLTFSALDEAIAALDAVCTAR